MRSKINQIVNVGQSLEPNVLESSRAISRGRDWLVGQREAS